MFPRSRVALLVAIAPIVIGPSIARAFEQSTNPQKPAPPGTGIIAGRVIDAATERPIAGASVVTGAPQLGEIVALTNGAGQFVIDGLPAGKFPLDAVKFGDVGGGPTGGVTLESGDRITNVVIRLWKRGAITGRVVDERGDPIVELEISAFRLGGPTQVPRPYEPMYSSPITTTDDRGAYRLGALMPGDYIVFVASTQTAVPRELVELSRSSTNPAERVAVHRALLDAGSTRSLPGRSDASLAEGDFVRTLGIAPSPSRGPDMVYGTTFYPSAATSTEAAIVSVAAGQERTGVDITMQPVASVRVSGRLTGAEGPIAFHPVRLVHETIGDFAYRPDPPVATIDH
jgi:hypothetical protein